MLKEVKHKIKATIEVEVRDKNGKLLSKVKVPSRSYVLNFGKALYGLMASINMTEYPITVQDTVNTGRNYPQLTSQNEACFYVKAGSGDDTFGVMIGTDDTAVSVNDYNMKVKIGNGTGSGQMVYGTSTLEAPTVVDSTIRWRLTRAFTNNSGASITVKECGIAFKWRTYYALILRDVLPSPQTVPDGATLTLRYTFSVTP